MSEVKLIPINEGNYNAVLSIKVAEDQKSFVASNVYSVAQAYIFKSMHPMCIYANDVLVGFLMYDTEPENKKYAKYYAMDRLMVAKDHQKKGYGRQAVELLKEIARKKNAQGLMTSYVQSNDIAGKLYSDLGMKKTGEIDDGEYVAAMEF